MADGGLRFPCEEDGLCQFDPPRASSACKAVTLGGAAESCLSVAAKIIKRPHVNWRFPAAHQLKRVLADSDREAMDSANFADKVA